MSQTAPGSAPREVTVRRGTTTLTRQRGGIVVQIQGVPTYQGEESGEVMIPGPLAIRLDDAMLAILDAIDQGGELPGDVGATG